jgi:hypothetical protein
MGEQFKLGHYLWASDETERSAMRARAVRIGDLKKRRIYTEYYIAKRRNGTGVIRIGKYSPGPGRPIHAQSHRG